MLVRRWTRNMEESLPKSMLKGLRYEAGDWFAEILGDQWSSYDIIKRVKQSEEEMIEWLQVHEVPRLPRDCFCVEEFEYQKISFPSSLDFQASGWKCQVQVQQQPAQLSLPLTQPPVSVPLRPHKVQGGQGGRQNNQQQRKPLPSSNQGVHERRQQPNLKRQGGHNQQQSSSSEQSPQRKVGNQKGQRPSQSTPSSKTLLHPAPAVSFEVQKVQPAYSHPRPKNHPRQSGKQRPTVSGSLSNAQSISICQIQD